MTSFLITTKKKNDNASISLGKQRSAILMFCSLMAGINSDQRCNRSTFFSTGTGTGVNVPTGPDRPVYRQEITIHLVQEKELETGLTVCK